MFFKPVFRRKDEFNHAEESTPTLNYVTTNYISAAKSLEPPKFGRLSETQ